MVSWNISCNTISTTVGMHSINKIYLSNLHDYFWELIWKPHDPLFIHRHFTVANIKMRPKCCYTAHFSISNWPDKR